MGNDVADLGHAKAGEHKDLAAIEGDVPREDAKIVRVVGKAPPDIKDLLADWRARAEIYGRAHRRAAVRFERRHYWLGIPSTLMGAIVGTAIFASMESTASNHVVKGVLAAASLLAAGLVALQTFLRYLERAGQHNAAYAEYEDIARALELLSMTTKAHDEWVKALEGFSQRLDVVTGRAPIPPDSNDLESQAEKLSDKLRARMHATIKSKAPREDDIATKGGAERRRAPRTELEMTAHLDAIRRALEEAEKRRQQAQPTTLRDTPSFTEQLREFETAPRRE